MTNPQGPPEDPTTWARPGSQGPLSRPPEASPEQRPTDQTQGDGPTQECASTFGQQQTELQTDPPAAANATTQRPFDPPWLKPSAGRTTQLATPAEEPVAGKAKKSSHRDPLTMFLVFIIVFSLVLAGLIGTELYARHIANTKVAQVVACEVKDQATASFGVAPLLLWQFATQHFTNITVETAGNQVRAAKGMKLQITIQNVQLENTPTSQGTVGALDATVTWSAEGIKQSVQNAIPVLGPFVTSKVIAHPSDGTIELKGMLNDITAKPVISENGLQLQIVSFNTLGFLLPKETVQSTLNDYTSSLTKNYPLGIHADSVDVTATGVVAHFSTRNANIPTGSNDQDPCFANL